MFGHGKNSVFKIDNAAGSLTDISAYLTDVDMPQSIKTAETTTFGAAAETFIAGIKGGTISITGQFDPAVDAILAGILGGITGGGTASFEYDPVGVVTPNPKYTGECLETAYNTKGAIGGAVTFTASFQISGAITRGTN